MDILKATYINNNHTLAGKLKRRMPRIIICSRTSGFVLVFMVFGYFYLKQSINKVDNTSKVDTSFKDDHSIFQRPLKLNNNPDGATISSINLFHQDQNSGLKKSPGFKDVSEFLNSSPDSDGMLQTEPVKFIQGVKNPCFALTNTTVNVVNISMTEAIQNGYEIRCLPYFYIAGFTKCGTTDIFKRLSAHRLVEGGYRKIPLKLGGWKEKVSVKESHFWDNMYFRLNSTMDYYSNFFKSETMVESFTKYGTSSTMQDHIDDFRGLLYGDGTPRTIWHGDTWHEDSLNKGEKEPIILLSHKLHHVNPNAKIIVSMRNPTDRLLSDFKFYYRGRQRPEVFHQKALDAIKWWNNCTQQMLGHTIACAYGDAPTGLSELGFEVCVQNKTMSRKMRDYPYETGLVCQSENGWRKNAADRLRVSMYDLYIKDWLEIFPKKNFLFLRFEDYIKDPAHYLETYILPFLGLPPFEKEIKEVISVKRVKNRSKSHVTMLPKTRIMLDQFYQKTKTSLVELLDDARFSWDD